MMVYHLLMAVLVIGVGVCCGMLWPQFKISLHPQYAVATVCSIYQLFGVIHINVSLTPDMKQGMKYLGGLTD